MEMWRMIENRIRKTVEATKTHMMESTGARKLTLTSVLFVGETKEEIDESNIQRGELCNGLQLCYKH